MTAQQLHNIKPPQPFKSQTILSMHEYEALFHSWFKESFEVDIDITYLIELSPTNFTNISNVCRVDNVNSE